MTWNEFVRTVNRQLDALGLTGDIAVWSIEASNPEQEFIRVSLSDESPHDGIEIIDCED